jgi:hypothetical protein
VLDARSFSIPFERSVRPAALLIVIVLHASGPPQPKNED